MAEINIVLIYADTGGGHRATAQAVAAGLRTISSGRVRTELVNATPYMPYPYNTAERAYPVAIARARAGYAAFWHLTNNKPYAAITRASMQLSGRHSITRFFAEHPADVYVSCHPLVNQMLPQAAKQLQPHAPFFAVVSDMVTIHSLFWSEHITSAMVPTDEARTLAIRHGMQPERVVVTGQPVLPDFAERCARGRSMRSELGLDPKLLTVLLMGGAHKASMPSASPTACRNTWAPPTCSCRRQGRVRLPRRSSPDCRSHSTMQCLVRKAATSIW